MKIDLAEVDVEGLVVVGVVGRAVVVVVCVEVVVDGVVSALIALFKA